MRKSSDGKQVCSSNITAEELKAKLDTLAARLQRPAPPDEYQDEPDCQRAVQLAEQVGRETSPSSLEAGAELQSESVVFDQLGQYQLVEKLGEGGMGAVYMALHTKLQKTVAIKVLRASRLRSRNAITRFEREMVAVGRLAHPNIVGAHDAGEVDGTHYLVMEYVAGVDLSQLSRFCGPLPAAEACELVRQAALGLQAAHEHGMVHRDIKPSNIMLTTTGQHTPVVKVLDLGLALLGENRSEDQDDLTSSGQMMGTLDYMAPEQSKDSRDVDIRADIYSLGATLYRLLCGAPPFSGDIYSNPVQLLTAILNEDIPSIASKRADLPAELVEIVHRMLARRPADRFGTPAELADSLQPFAEGADLETYLVEAAEICQAMRTPSHVDSGDYLGLSSRDTAEDVEPTQLSPSSLLAANKNLQPVHSTVAPDPKPPKQRRTIVIATAIVSLLLLAAVTVMLQTRRGTLIVEFDDPTISVTLQGEEILISDPTVSVDPRSDNHKQAGQPIRVRPGKHRLHVQQGELGFSTDEFTVSRGGKTVLTIRRAAGQIQVLDDGKLLSQAALETKRPASAATEQGSVLAGESSSVAVERWTLALTKLEGHTDVVRGVAFLRDGRQLISGSADKTLRVWDLSTGQVIKELATGRHVTRLAISPDRRWVLSGSDSFRTSLWDTHTWEQLKHFQTSSPSVKALAFSPFGNLMVTGEANGAFTLWDIASAQRLKALENPNPAGGNALAWLPDGQTVVAGDNDGHLTWWKHGESQPFHRLENVYRYGVISLLALPDGKRMITTGGQGQVTLRDSQTGEVLREFSGHSRYACTSALFSDGKHFATGGDDQTIRIWDIDTGSEVHKFEADTWCTRHIAVSPDGQFIASAAGYRVVERQESDGDFGIRIWRIPSSILGELNKDSN